MLARRTAELAEERAAPNKELDLATILEAHNQALEDLRAGYPGLRIPPWEVFHSRLLLYRSWKHGIKFEYGMRSLCVPGKAHFTG